MTFIFDVLPENVIVSVRMWLFLKIKRLLIQFAEIAEN